jgi:two-component system cell cycle sensor histidine kinase/response regulator CckA
VYGIIKQSGGSISVASEPGQGTTFRIYLPRVNEAIAQRERKRAEPDDRPQGEETLLVVEDEEAVRRLTCEALRTYGYRVIEAANGEEALHICEQIRDTIPLTITDVVMPQISGRKLSEKLRELHPEMQILYMSGYPDDDEIQHEVLDPALFFLEKPFTPTALARRVREILDRASP